MTLFKSFKKTKSRNVYKINYKLAFAFYLFYSTPKETPRKIRVETT